MAACRQISWYVPCHWARTLGTRIELDMQAQFKVRTKHLGWRESNPVILGDGQISCPPWKVDADWRPWAANGDYDWECENMDNWGANP